MAVVAMPSFGEFLKRVNLDSLRISVPFLSAEFRLSEADKAAAWDLYVELLTRVTTQHLLPEEGDEATALHSIHSLFATTRDILKRYGPSTRRFAYLAIPVLNQMIRPFTAKWHGKIVADPNCFKLPEACSEFRRDLVELQLGLRKYTFALGVLAEVEDLSALEAE